MIKKKKKNHTDEDKVTRKKSRKNGIIDNILKFKCSKHWQYHQNHLETSISSCKSKNIMPPK